MARVIIRVGPTGYPVYGDDGVPVPRTDWPVAPSSPSPVTTRSPPPPALPPAVTPIDPQQLAATLYGKKIPAILADLVEVGGRIIEGPIELVIDNEQCVSFIAGYYLPINYWDDTRTVTELWFRGKKAWSLSGGSLLSNLHVGGATVNTEQRVRFLTGQLNQAPDAWSVSKFGVDDANGYGPLVIGIFENIRKAQFGGLDPFTSVVVEDTAFGAPGDGIAWADALAAVARHDGRGSDVFETVDVSRRTRGIVLGDSLYYPDFLSGMRKLKPQWSILTDRKLRVIEKGVFSLDLTVDLANVLAHDDAPIVFHGSDSFDKPRKMVANFVDIDRDYEPNQVEAYEDSDPVPVTDSFNADEFNVPLVSSSSEMIADVNYAYYSGEMARETSEFTGMAPYYGLEPGDTLQLVTDERDYFHRVIEVVRKVDFTVDIKAEGFLTCAIAVPDPKIVAVGATDGSFSVPFIMGSSGGSAWDAKTADATIGGMFGIAASNSIFVGVGHDGSSNAAVSSSAYGRSHSWTYQTSSIIANAEFFGVTFGGSQFVAVGTTIAGALIVSTSPDGVTWTQRSISGSGNLLGVAYGGGKYVAVGSGSFNPLIYSSPDGITWTARTPSPSTLVYLFAVSHNGTLFVAVGSHCNGFGDRTDPCIMTSPDGVTWTERTAAPTTGVFLQGVFCTASLCVAVGTDPLGNPVIMTSPDGVTWTAGTPAPPSDAILNAVVFDTASSSWVAVGNTATQNPIIMTAPAVGTPWTQRTPDPTTNVILQAVAAKS